MDFLDSVLIIGSGGREHAILKALLRSNRPLCLYAYPGNAGMENDGCMLIEEPIDSWSDLASWSVKNEIDLAVIGPEVPLVEGLADKFDVKGITAFGPSKRAAQIEGSKEYSKNLMKKYGIPTADFESFSDKESAQKYLDEKGAPIVIKVSGLAAGKGAIVCDTKEDADAALKSIYDDNDFGDAGNTVVIEEKMIGQEASVFVLSDGKTYKILPVAQDHKQIFDGDKGPNTGGMGAYAPAPIVDAATLKTIEETIIVPTLDALKEEKATYRGLLYVGVMLTEEGPKVVEYNCRFGDPETQAVLPLVDCDWYEIFEACSKGTLADVQFQVKEDKACVAVVLASEGYPGSYEKGKIISGIETAERSKMNVDVYHAGTQKDENEDFVTNGGRVLAVSAIDDSLEDAIASVYENISYIDFDGKTFRRDIGLKGVQYKKG